MVKKTVEIPEKWINCKLEKSNQLLATIHDLKDIDTGKLLLITCNITVINYMRNFS